MREKDYERFKYKRNFVPRMKRHTKDDSMFLFYFKKNNKLYRKLYASAAPTKGSRVEDASKALDSFYKSAGRVRDDVDINISVNNYWDEFVARKVIESYNEITKQMERDWSNNHKRTMTGIYNLHIKSFIGSKKIASITVGNIDDVMLNAKTKSKRLQKGILEILEPLFKRAIRDGLREDSPIDEDNKVKRNFSKEKKIIMNPKDKFVSIYDAIKNIENVKIRTAFMFGFNGRRLQEVLKMKWEDVDFNAHSYYIPPENSKVDTGMTFALNNELMVLLRALYDGRNSIYIFSSNRDSSIPMARLSQYYDCIRTDSGIKEFTFHWMRNLLVSTLADKGVAVADLSAILGHQDDATIKKYLSLQRENAGNRAHDAMEAILSPAVPARTADDIEKIDRIIGS